MPREPFSTDGMFMPADGTLDGYVSVFLFVPEYKSGLFGYLHGRASLGSTADPRLLPINVSQKNAATYGAWLPQ